MVTAGERLHLLYEINRRLATFTDLDELLRYATRRVREVYAAEGCALLLHDRERNEFSFPVSSQSESNPARVAMEEIRFPADRGIAGWVLSHGEATRVDDAADDPRFYGEVDKLTHLRTRALICAPLRTRSGNIGVIEVVNPKDGRFTAEDLELLDAVATDVAVAYEKAQFYGRLRDEVSGLRQACGIAGIILLLMGLVTGVGAAIGHLARGLPLPELLARPALLVGLLSVVVGALLIVVGRGGLVARAPSAPAGAG